MKKKTIFGNCTQIDAIEHIFGDVSAFACQVEENGDNFEYEGFTITYDKLTDVHTFWH